MTSGEAVSDPQQQPADGQPLNKCLGLSSSAARGVRARSRFPGTNRALLQAGALLFTLGLNFSPLGGLGAEPSLNIPPHDPLKPCSGRVRAALGGWGLGGEARPPLGQARTGRQDHQPPLLCAREERRGGRAGALSLH